MAEIIVIGGGLAGLASAAALAGAGHRVQLFEMKPFLGGRATSYEIGNGEEAEFIDNCQHILLRCCVNLLDFYKRLGVENRVAFQRDFYFIEPGGRTSILRRGMLPAPAHFAGSFLKLKFLNLSEKIAVARAIQAIDKEWSTRTDLDRITMQQWLEEKKQPPRAIERFWRQVLVSAINEELHRMAASHGFQVFRLGFIARSDSYEMGIPAVPLGELYSEDAWKKIGNVRLHMRSAVSRIVVENGAVSGVISGDQTHRADAYICAVPFERLTSIFPEHGIDLSPFEHSPITGIHLWFDRPVTDLAHATLLDRNIQWVFNKETFNKQTGRYLQLVVSASRNLTEMPRADVIALALRELAEFFPAVASAKLEKAHVVKEVRATFSAKPNLEAARPVNRTAISNLFLAGDWTRSGWPATMEGAVRSGYKAAEAAAESLGAEQRFLLPDIA
ncbi:MAG: hydroxysqualene dehydroxylase HpnE [Bryobacteraceae bacterium]